MAGRELRRIVLVVSDVSTLGGIQLRTLRTLRAAAGRDVEYLCLSLRDNGDGAHLEGLRGRVMVAEADPEGVRQTIEGWDPADTVVWFPNNALRGFDAPLREAIDRLPLVHVGSGQLAYFIQDSGALLDRDYVEGLRATKAVVLSRMDRQTYAQFGDHDRIVGFNPVATREENAFDPRGRNTRVTYVGRIDDRTRGGDRLLALARATREAGFPPLRVFTVSDPRNSPDLETLRASIRSNGAEELFDFVFDEIDHDRIFAEAAVLVQPSRKESFGNAIVEAYSYGVPVISSSYAPGPAELVEHGRTGLLLDDYRSETLVAALRSLTPETLVAMSAAAFERHRQYSMERYLAFVEGTSRGALAAFDGRNRLPVFPRMRSFEEAGRRIARADARAQATRDQLSGVQVRIDRLREQALKAEARARNAQARAVRAKEALARAGLHDPDEAPPPPFLRRVLRRLRRDVGAALRRAHRPAGPDPAAEARALDVEAAALDGEARMAGEERTRLERIARLAEQPVPPAATDQLDGDDRARAEDRAALDRDRGALAAGEGGAAARAEAQHRRQARGTQRRDAMAHRAERQVERLARLEARESRRVRQAREAAVACEVNAAWDDGDFARAEALWSRMAAEDPLNPVPRVGLARVFRRIGAFHRCEEEYEAFARALEGHPSRDLNLGLLAGAAKMTDRAKDHFDRAVEQGIAEYAGWKRALAFYRQQGMPAAALALLDRCLGGAPGAPALGDGEAAAFRRSRDEVVADLAAVGWDVDARGAPPEAMRLHDEAARAICARPAPAVPYDPVPGRVMLVVPSLGGGGVQRQSLNLVRFLPAEAPALEGVVVLPLLGDASQDHHRAAFAEAGAQFADPVPGTDAPLPPDLPGDAARMIETLPARYARDVRHLMAEIRRWRPETVHGWTEPVSVSVGLAAMLTGVPRVVLGARSSAPIGRRAVNASDFFHAALAALLAHEHVTLTTNCQASADEFEAWLGCGAGRVRTIYNGVDVDAMRAGRSPGRAAALRAGLGVPEAAPLVMAAFRITTEKRPLLWAEAAAGAIALRPDLHFAMLGDGVLRESVADLVAARSLAERIHLPGRTEEVENWIEAASAVFLTSNFEGTANIVLEAQALGRPVIVPDVGGLAESFRPGVTGILFDPDEDAGTLSRRIVDALGDPALAEAARGEGEAFIRERFAIDAFVRSHRDLYGLSGRGAADGVT
ncbi:glycosyltransferase [Jannaschia sp. W003]|uniref:glycosyltransferase n=1 Tax=Jannaschia sp. W003 TaxID=2867012 RepID=UPI0021A610F5|nr:glycosyltransferase [Jannaschia sp. W003]UWQ23105.1 glycosyltransferase [Jannaschia sp. W003]